MVYFDWRLTLLSVGILPLFALVGAGSARPRAASGAGCRPSSPT